MIEQLFGSKTRVALLKLFYDNPEQAYYVRELTREIDAQINSVRRELNNLINIGIIMVNDNPVNVSKEPWEEDETPKGLNKKKFYQLDASCVLNDELSSIFAKSHLLFERDLINQLKEMGNIQLLILTGCFTGLDSVATDMLVVGNVNRDKIVKTIQSFEKKLDKEINYTMMSLKEYEYRKDITDKFLYDILVNPKIVVLDTVGVKEEIKK